MKSEDQILAAINLIVEQTKAMRKEVLESIDNMRDEIDRLKKRNAQQSIQQPDDQIAYTVKGALATGAFPNRTKIYRAIVNGEIDTYMVGRSRMITAVSLRRYVQRKLEEA